MTDSPDITTADLHAADALWRSHVPASFAGLLRNEGWTWDAQDQAYRSRHGTRLTWAKLRPVLLAFIDSIGDELRKDAREGFAEESPNANVKALGLPKWASAVANKVKAAAIAVTGAVRGGLSRMTTGIISRLVGNPADPKPPTAGHPPTLSFAMDRLARFAASVAIAAPQADTVDTVTNRAGLYADYIHSVAEDQRRESHKDTTDERGRPLYTVERNVLGEAEHHCTDGDNTEGCIETTAAGWQPIGTLPPPGTRTCGPRCRCQLQYALRIPEESDLDTKGYDDSEPRDDHGRWTSGRAATDAMLADAHSVNEIAFGQAAAEVMDHKEDAGKSINRALRQYEIASAFQYQDYAGNEAVERLATSHPDAIETTRIRAAELKQSALRALAGHLANEPKGETVAPTLDSLKGAYVVDAAKVPGELREAMTVYATSHAVSVPTSGGLVVVPAKSAAGILIRKVAHKTGDELILGERLSDTPIFDRVNVQAVTAGSSQYKRLGSDVWLKNKEGDESIVGADRVPVAAGGTKQPKEATV